MVMFIAAALIVGLIIVAIIQREEIHSLNTEIDRLDIQLYEARIDRNTTYRELQEAQLAARDQEIRIEQTRRWNETLIRRSNKIWEELMLTKATVLKLRRDCSRYMLEAGALQQQLKG